MKRSSVWLLVFAWMLWMMPARSSAAIPKGSHGGRDHVSFGDTVTVSEDEPADDVVCAFCTVRVRGDVNGDLVTFFGKVDVAEGHSLHGDVAVFGGDLSLAKDTTVAGDLVVFGGDLHQDAAATVQGSHVVFAGGGWILVALLPLLIPIALIWLVVRLVARRRYVFPAYPGGRF